MVMQIERMHDSVARVIKINGPLSETRIAQIARDVISGLHCLHQEHKVIHRYVSLPCAERI